jgi:hypothetical protein
LWNDVIMSDIEPPAGLEASGMALWESVTGPYMLTPAELSILAQACRTADELDRLEAAVRELPDFVVRGSTGQPKVHPLLEEARRHRLLLERLCAALNLPDQDEKVGQRAGARHAAKAARARWANHEAVS